METVLIVGAVIAVVVGLVALGSYLEKKRTEAMTAFAQANGFVMEQDLSGFRSSLAEFKLFNQGHSRDLRNLMRGSRDDLSVSICDYKYVTGHGKQSQTHSQTVCVLRSPKLRLPHFFARRQVALFDFLGKVFGGQDINFDEDPAFSKAFVLQTSGSEDELRRLFQQPLRSQLTALAPKGVQLEAREDTVVYHQARRLKPEQLAELVDDALAVRRSLG